jgi:3-oxoacyl-[acyl-carrier-protein] synthase-3
LINKNILTEKINKMGIRIIGTGSYVPEKVLTNFDLEKIVDTTDEWIRTRTGTVERRIARDDEPTSHMGLEAAKNALKMANVSPDEIDLIVVGTVTPDMCLPTTACIIQHKLKVKSAACFDFQAACTGFIYGVEIVSSLMKNNRSFKKALLIGAEKLSSVVNWEDRNTCVLFGDAAGAVVFEKTKDAGDTVLSSAMHATYSNILTIPGGGSLTPITPENVNEKLHTIKMEGNKVFKLAVNAMVNSCNEALDLANLSYSDISWLIPHQANMRIIKAIGARLDMPEERVCINIEKYGNTSVCSIMLALDELVRSGKVHKGDKILATAFGGGMTWGAAVLDWSL